MTTTQVNDGAHAAVRRDDAADVASAQYGILRRRILDGELPVGHALVESALSTSAGVSRTPIREALARLEAEGLVERTTRGLRVRIRTIEEIHEIHEVRLALDVEAARLAAGRRTLIDLARLRHIQAQERAHTGEGQSSILHHDWHEAMRRAAHNDFLLTNVGAFDALLRLYDVNLYQDEDALTLAASEHGRIFEAIEAQDAATAAALTAEHGAAVRDRHITALVDSGL